VAVKRRSTLSAMPDRTAPGSASPAGGTGAAVGDGRDGAAWASLESLKGGRTVENLIADELRESILNGALAPGSRLPIRDLGAQLGVSVTPIRIALKQLAGEGLVDLTPHAGATVGQLTVEELEELLATRDGIESWLAFRGAPALTGEALGEIDAALAALRRAVESGDARAYLGASWEMRVPCYAAAGRPRLFRRATELFQRSRRYHLLNLSEQSRREWSLDLFVRFAAACHDGDGALAREITHQGLEWTLDYLVEALQATTS
jgi:DNA-binding GntR family transcriptional regulator